MKRVVVGLAVCCLVAGLGVMSCSFMPGHRSSAIPRMSPEELRGQLSDTSVMVIDVRTSGGWEAGKTKIKGAVRENPKADVAGWSGKYTKDNTYVLYCS